MKSCHSSALNGKCEENNFRQTDWLSIVAHPLRWVEHGESICHKFGHGGAVRSTAVKLQAGHVQDRKRLTDDRTRFTLQA